MKKDGRHAFALVCGVFTVELEKVNFVLQLSRIANRSLFSAVCWLTSGPPGQQRSPRNKAAFGAGRLAQVTRSQPRRPPRAGDRVLRELSLYSGNRLGDLRYWGSFGHVSFCWRQILARGQPVPALRAGNPEPRRNRARHPAPQPCRARAWAVPAVAGRSGRAGCAGAAPLPVPARNSPGRAGRRGEARSVRGKSPVSKSREGKPRAW